MSAEVQQLFLRLDAPPVAPRRLSQAPTSLEELWERRAGAWSRLWGVRDLRQVLQLELSHRMRTSLGYYLPESLRIRISDVLLEGPPGLLEEIVCHEAAHAAVELLHGTGVRPHGREWKALMKQAGYEPRVRIPGEALGAAAQRAARRRWVWDHRCPICRAQRTGGRPVRQWRCVRCLEAGRSGELEITRRLRSRQQPRKRYS